MFFMKIVFFYELSKVCVDILKYRKIIFLN